MPSNFTPVPNPVSAFLDAMSTVSDPSFEEERHRIRSPRPKTRGRAVAGLLICAVIGILLVL